ncbi:hypothetical protein C0Q70_08792 [Pomacea canaliculata]|uniref:Poly [ADP-ribose] polymerase n=1 Tax=Pomacea canaliculata TaxID=400727 RepID=A0A2T7P809_POMCA|nr:hypothetical protein C0Q70_08792 [Pomacea canaliculata]
MNTTDDDVAHYFESMRAGGSTVLRVEHVEDQRKCVFFEDPEVARRVALKKHLLGGRELRVRLYLDCLGPYGGSEDPYVFVLPEPLEVSVKENIKVHFLQHGTRILQNLNERLSTFHACATVVDSVLKIECTLNKSLPRVHLLVNGWRDEIKKQVDVCFDSVRLDRLEVLPEIWPDVMKTVDECEVSGDDMILPLVDEHMLVILGRKNVERNTFEKIKAIVDKWEKELVLKKGEVNKTKNLKKHELDLLIMFSFPSIIEEQYNSLNESDLEKAVDVIQTSLMEEAFPLDEVSSKVVSTNQPDKRRKKTGDHSMVSAMVANITELAVDAIVNAANSRMQHGGGVAGAIVAKGGREIQEECNRTIKTRGELSEGDVLVSGPGKLPCKSIIHAVGPRYKGGNKGEEECLRSTVFNCLKAASDRGYTSIALPAISSGIFGYPVEEATRVIVEAVRSYFQSTTGSSVRDVRLCDIVQSTVDLFQTALDGSSLGKETTVITHDPDEGFQGIQVFVVEGEIARQDTDVIVNSTSQDLNLTQGAISSSILKAAGPGLQRECKEKYPKGITGDKIACTNSFNMRCKAIFHVALCNWANEAAAKQLESVVKSCLKEASKRHFTSMAIPALGTGTLRFPREVAARTIISTVNRFHQTSPNTSLKEVKVVVFKDPKTFEVFSAEGFSQMKRQETKIDTDTEEYENNNGAPISFREGSQEAFGGGADEAAEDLTDFPVRFSATPATTIFSEPMTYEKDSTFDLDGLCLTVKKGDITEEAVDVIVNSSNGQLDLSRGAVSKALKAKCGKDLKRECETKPIPISVADMARHNIVMTAAYKLKCKHILHIDALAHQKSGGWEKAYTVVLQEAEKRGLHSLAVPALGTGNINLSPFASAQALATALTVHKQSVNTLRKVTVVLYDNAMVQTFCDVLRVLGKQGNARLPGKPETDIHKKSLFQRAIDKFAIPFKARRDPVPDEFKFYIFSANEEKRQEFLRALYQHLDCKFENKEIKELENWSVEELKEVKKVCKSLNVEVQKKPTGAVVLRGMREDVERSREIIATFIKETEQQRQETVMANLVQWYYFESTTTGTERKAFGKKENRCIEEAFQTDQTNESVELSDDNDYAYVVNFTQMKKYSKDNPSNGVRVMRKEIIKGGASSASLLPDTWDFQEEEEAVKLVHLPSGGEEYKNVSDNFARTAKGKFTIISIERIQNPELYKQYLAKKVQMNKQNKGRQSETTLWHGTSSDVVQHINRDGFNRSFCGKNATYYGQGVYFAVDSSYSMQETYSPRTPFGMKYIYQCKVLVGYSVTGNQSMKTLPIRQGNIRYDSTTNDEQKPAMYVIFHDSQAYPEYLITFK